MSSTKRSGACGERATTNSSAPSGSGITPTSVSSRTLAKNARSLAVCTERRSPPRTLTETPLPGKLSFAALIGSTPNGASEFFGPTPPAVLSSDRSIGAKAPSGRLACSGSVDISSDRLPVCVSCTSATPPPR